MASNMTRLQLEEQLGKAMFNNLNRYFLSWYLPLILLVGTIGGLFCTLFIFMSKMFPKIIQVWLVSICIGDFMILAWDAGRMFVKQAFNIDFRDEGLVICKMQVYLSNFFFYWSAYNQAAISVQRLVFIASPLRARTLLSTQRVFAIWGCMTVLLLFPNITYLLYWHIGDRNDCEPVDKWFYYVTTLVHLVVWGIIPLASMLICTGCIPYRLVAYKRSGHFKDNKKKTQRSESRTPKPPALIGGRRHGSDQGAHVTRLLVCMNLFYLCTTFPLLIYMMDLNFRLENNVGETIARSLHKFYYYLFRSLCFLNASLNWVFYCAAGKIFRQKSKQILYRIFCGRAAAAAAFGTGSQPRSTLGNCQHHVVHARRSGPRGSAVALGSGVMGGGIGGSSEILSALTPTGAPAAITGTSANIGYQLSLMEFGNHSSRRIPDSELQEAIQRLQQEDRL